MFSAETWLALSHPLVVAACTSAIPIDDAMLKADELLYQAKAEGRNRVVSASL